MSVLSKILSFKVLAVLSFPVALLISGGMVMQGSTAAFSGVTNGAQESWDGGKVALTNNHASALFSAGVITPGYSETHCITINSTANVPSILKMYTSAVSSTGTPALSSFLNVEVIEGSEPTRMVRRVVVQVSFLTVVKPPTLLFQALSRRSLTTLRTQQRSVTMLLQQVGRNNTRLL